MYLARETTFIDHQDVGLAPGNRDFASLVNLANASRVSDEY